MNDNIPVQKSHTRAVRQSLQYLFLVILLIGTGSRNLSFSQIQKIDSPDDGIIALNVTATKTTLISGETTQLTVLAFLRDGSTQDLTNPSTGTIYMVTDPSIATVDANGLVTTIKEGNAVIKVTTMTAHVEFLTLTVLVRDTDNDGLPDHFEIEHGLDPNDPTDAGKDKDADGFTNLEEFLRGTNVDIGDLDENCLATVLNRTTQIDSDGNYALPNVPVPVGALRIRTICERQGKTLRGQSPFMLATPNGITQIGEITFGIENQLPVSLATTAPTSVLTKNAPTVQLVTTGTLPDNTTTDLTLGDTGTFYVSSNPAIASVSKDGLVTAVTSGNVLITATHEGVIATIILKVELTQDSDGDGMPDDYEQANSVNPGGANLARLPGTQVGASSFSSGFPPARAIDGNSQTSWFTGIGDAANKRSAPFIEVTLPSDVNVAQIRLLGNRQNPIGFDFFAGIFQAFDAGGAEIFNSGAVQLPAPTRDIAVPLDINGIRRVRFTSTADESNTPGLSEIQVISRPGGAGLDPNNINDAALDFDQDGLTNLQEFNLGTSIFLNDTDSDGLDDGQEITFGSNPVLADTDGDGLLDGNELNPTVDSDGDGVKNILDPDSDNDGLPDGVEVNLGLNPLAMDSNGNGIPDGSEDGDRDGLPNIEEISEHTDPTNPDTDNDRLLDGEEVIAGADGFITDPLRADTDADGMQDGYESRFRVNRINPNEPGLNPNNPNDAGLDPDGDGFSNLQESELDTDPFDPDITAPAVSQIEPPDGAMNFPVNGVIIVRFAEPLSPESVVDGVVRVIEDTTEVPGSVKLSNDGLSITFTPAEQLLALTPHTVKVQGVRDIAGNRMTQLFQSTFTTAVFVDTQPPFVLRTSPSSGTQNVPVNSPITIEFSERMDPATLTPANFTVFDQFIGRSVPGMVQVDPDGRTASFVPTQPFAVGRPHSVTLSSNIKDAAGNSLGFNFLNFTTSFVTDTVRPRLIATSPVNGDTEIPVNALLMINFDEPLNTVNFLRGIRISRAGVPVAGSFALSDGNRRVTFTSAAALASNSVHAIVVDTAVTDLVGNPLDNPGSVIFDTGSTGDITFPSLTQIDPASNASGVGTNAVVRMRFSERINPLTLNDSNFNLLESNTGIKVDGAITVAADRRSATFTPASLLRTNTSYSLQVFSVTDFAGHQLSFFSSFVTGDGADNTAPTVTAVSPPAGTLDVPVNTRVVVRLSEPVSILSVGSNAVTLSQSGTPVTGTLTLEPNGRNTLTFTPANPLATSSSYTINVSGLTDLAGNAVTPFSSSFSTRAANTADTTSPTVISVAPANNAMAVPVNTQITLTFSEPIDPTTIINSNVSISIDGLVGVVSGSYAVNGAVVTFTPATSFPANVRVRVQAFNVRDLAGNNNNFFQSSFVTAADTPDTTPPQVVMVTPSDGATNVNRSTPVVLSFSESLDANTINNNTVALFANGDRIFPSINRSADNRTVTMNIFLPADSVITIAVTSDVKDLSGNQLAEFRSQFTTTNNVDTGHPSVVSQRPGTGANGVALDSSIVLYISEPLNQATINDALHVSQNGVLVDGTIKVSGNGQVIEFVPAAPWQRDAFVQIFLDSTAKDLAGNTLNNYQGQFRTIPDTSTTAPQVIRTSPVNFFGLSLNQVFEVEYNEALDATTVNSNNVTLQQGNGAFIPSTVSLIRDGRVIRLKPNAPLAPNTFYFLTVTTNIRDLDGTAPTFVFQRNLTTGTVADNTAPQVLSVSPPDGATPVGINANIHVRFDEPVNPLSVNGTTVLVTDGVHTSMPSSISFSNNNQDVVIVPHAPLPETTQLTLKVEGVEDLSGNPVASQTTHFTTAAGPDLTRAQVTRTNPFNGATNVPVNTLITIETNEPIDVSTVNNNTFIVRDNVTGQNVAGTLSVNANGRMITFMPNAPLAVSRSYSVFFSFQGILDLAGNFLDGSNIFFTTSFASDATAPQVVAISPANGLSAVPLNAAVMVQFNEPVQSASADQVTLSAGGVNVNVIRSLSNSNQTLTLKPVGLLEQLKTYNLNITGVKDLSGNTLAAPVSSSFITSAGVDLINPTVTQADPASNATGVGTNAVVRLQFSERINPLTVTNTTFTLTHSNTGLRIDGAIAVAANGLSATFTPASPLLANSPYFVQAFNITDLASHQVSFFISFTTGGGADNTAPTVVAVSPPAGATDVPVNARVVVRLSEPVSILSVGNSAVTLSQGGTPVTGALSLDSSERRTLTFTPANPLSTSSSYTVNVSGLTDVPGNAVTPFSSSFSTRAGNTADTTPPTVSSVAPANNATAVPVNTQITLTFSEPIDPTTINSNNVFVSIDRFGGVLSGSYAVNGAVVTFTPTTPFPANERVRVQVFNVRDLAGNNNNFFQSSFVTAADTPDTTPPQVVMVTPSDGATNVTQSTPVVLTFSESLDASTVNNNTVAIFFNGEQNLFPSITRSADNRTVTMNIFLPADSVITVAVTSDVKDLSGNRLADFRSQFTTGNNVDTGHPFLVSQRPGNGASGVALDSSIVLYISEPLNQATINGALHVSQNGVLVDGTIKVSGNGQVIEFVPAAPWQPDAFIQIFLDSTAKDLAGNTFNNHQGQFRTLPDTSTTAPQVLRTSPINFSGLSLNQMFEVEYNEPLDATTVNSNNVTLQQSNNGALIPSTVSLLQNGRVIRLRPNANLAANTTYFLTITTNIRDLDGTATTFVFQRFLTTGTVADNIAPQVLTISPPDGATPVGINANIHLRFDEPVNPLSVNGTTILVTDGVHTSMPSSISFSNNNQDVVIVPHAPLPETTQLTLKVEGVEDLSGNAVMPQTTHFTTGAGPDLTRAQVTRNNPFNGATNVPVNTLVTIETNEPIDPSSVNNNTFVVRDDITGVNVAGTLSINANGRLITFMPNAPLTASRRFSVFTAFSGILDLAGNLLEGINFSFTTAAVSDATAPQVVAISPANGLSAVPVNAAVSIQFNEPIQSLSFDQVTLSAGGVNVNVIRSLSNSNQTLTLKPVTLLAGLTTYNLNIAGVKDLSGNTLAAPVSSSFTTSAGVDLISPTVTQVDPVSGATGVPTNTVVRLQFSERINPLTVSNATFIVTRNSTGVRVEGSVTVAADGLSATFTPASPLLANNTYVVQAFSITDLAGRQLSFFSSFTTGP